MFAHRCVVVGVMLTTLGGCVALEVGPDRVFPVDGPTGQVAFVQSYEAAMKLPLPSNGNEAARNDFITERMYAMDLEYNQYFSRLTNQLALGNSSLDVVSTALSAAGTAFASAVTKTALSAAATVVNGTRTAMDKDILVSNTIQILQSTMESGRNHTRLRILGNLQNCRMDQYTLWQALTDLEDYYRAGTLPGALEALAAAAGNNSQQTKDVKNGSTQISTKPLTTTGQTSNGGPVTNLGGSQQAPTQQCTASTQIKQSAKALAAQIKTQQQQQP